MSAVELPITMSGTRPIIVAKINGEEARFILDSGAFYSMVSQAAADEYKLHTQPAPYGLTVKGIGGTTQARVARVKAFGLAGATIPDVEFLVGGSEVGSEAIGLLGQNFLEKWDVEYDLAKGVIRLMKNVGCSHNNLAYWLKPDQDLTKIPIFMTSPMEPHTRGDAYVNGVKIRVVFDTGASTSVLSLRAAARAGVKPDMPGVTDAGFGWGIGRNAVRSYIAQFDSLKFGEQGEEIKHPRLRIEDIDPIEADMLIGSDFFLSHRILVANSQHQLYFSYNGGPVFNLSKNVAKSAPTENSQQGAPTASNVQAAAAAADAAPPADAPANAVPPSAAPPSAAPQGDAAPNDAAGLARRGAAYAGRRDFEHAIPDMNRAIELDPKNPEYFYLRATMFWQQRDLKSASADLDQTIALNPNYVPALIGRARLRISDKNVDGARSDLESADRTLGKQDNARLDLAEMYNAIGNRDAAIAQYDLWLPSHEDDVQLAKALTGRCWDRAILGRDLSEALVDCNKAISRSSRGANGPEFASRGLTRLRLGDYDKAIADYDTAIQLRPKDAWSLYGRGIAKIRKSKKSEGEADINAATQIAPDMPKHFESMGILP
jgi:tetratricopeptide (TPR) repeat protein/predicted aspartyl protease